MRTSFYVACVPIPQSDRFLLFQTVRGAVDVVPKEVAQAIQQFGDPSAVGWAASPSLNEAEVKTLTERGYLTEQAAEQDQAREVLRLASKYLRRRLELVFRLPPEAENPSRLAADRERLDEIFSLASALKGDEGLLWVRFDVSTPTVQANSMDRVLEAALGRDYLIFPHVTMDGLDGLRPWLKSENFKQTMLVTDRSNLRPDPRGVARKIVRFFKQQVQVSWKCNVDGMSPEQLEAVRSIHERVRKKYSVFQLFLHSDGYDGTAEPEYITTEKGPIPFISSENEVVLNTLLRFIGMPNQVNYNPFFQPGDDKLIVDLGADRISFQCGTDWQPVTTGRMIEGLDEIRRHVEAEPTEKEPERIWAAVQQASECLSCKYALVCGRDWIGKYGYATAERCAGLFERRMAQTLPLMLSMLRGNWRPPGSQADGQ